MTRRHAYRWLIAVVALSLALAAACTSDDSASTTITTGSSTTAATDSGATTTTASSDGSSGGALAPDYPCTLFDTDELIVIVGNELDDGDGNTNYVTENDVNYDSELCQWGVVGGDGNRLDVQVSDADDFPSGSVECPPPLIASDSVSGVGNEAVWRVESVSDTEVGTLRVCSDEAFVVVTAAGPVGEDHQAMAVEVAGLALAALA